MEVISSNKTAANTVEAEFKATADEFEAALQSTFVKQRKNISVPGFRKGKATRKMIENYYGENVFYQEAVDSIYRDTAQKAVDELGLQVVDMPEIEVTDISKENGVSFKAVFTTKPEVEIPGYKGLKVTKTVKTVTDEDVDAELQKLRERNARIIDVTDRPLEKGDTAVFDFEGFIDGEAFEGGKADGFTLEVGSGQFIPGFEDGMIGKSLDEPFEVNVTFPEDYHVDALKGKPAVFKCLIHEIKTKEYDELDDEFVKDVSEFDTLDALKADIKEKQEEKAKEEAAAKVDNDITEQLINALQAEIPAVMIDDRVDSLVRDWEYRNRYQGITVKDYLKFANITIEQFKENFKEPAEKQVKLRLALEKIVELEGITVTEEEVNAEYEKMAENYKMDIEEVKKVIVYKAVEMDLCVEKAFDTVRESAEVTEVSE